MMTIQLGVGKLYVCRFRPPLTAEELTAFTLDVRTFVTAAPEPIAFCCDWRAVTSFDKDIFDTLVWTMRRDNPKVLCNAVLVAPENTAFGARIEQLLTEGKNPSRRMFTDVPTLEAFIHPLLTAPERKHLAGFLARR